MEKVPARFPKRLADIILVIRLQHVTHTSKIPMYFSQRLEQKNNITIFLEPVIAAFQASEITFFNELPRPIFHEWKNSFQEPFKYLDFAVRELRRKKTGDFDILFFIISVNEFNRIIADEMNKAFPLFIVNIV